MILRTAARLLLECTATKIAYPSPRISIGARIVNHSTIGNNASVGFNSLVIHSILGDNVTVSHGCSVSNCGLEEYAFVYPRSLLADVHVGKFSYVGYSSVVTRTRIGRFCSMGPHLICGIGLHPTDFVSTSPVFYSTGRQCGTTFSNGDHFREREDIVIGHDVWIGARVFVRDGVRIGHGAVVGAGAVVADDVPDYAIVGGVPAKLIRFRFPDRIIAELNDVQWWNWSTEKLRETQRLFAQTDIDSFLDWALTHYAT